MRRPKVADIITRNDYKKETRKRKKKKNIYLCRLVIYTVTGARPTDSRAIGQPPANYFGKRRSQKAAATLLILLATCLISYRAEVYSNSLFSFGVAGVIRLKLAGMETF
jgi:hypothetical protein